MRQAYGEKGVEGFYKENGVSYRNPHFTSIVKVLQVMIRKHVELINGVSSPVRFLDLACGSGEASIAFKGICDILSIDTEIVGVDPFTAKAFEDRTGMKALVYTFQDISDGCLSSHSFDICICSFALHLLDDSKLFSTLYELASICTTLIVLTPHKRPLIKQTYGWDLIDEIVVERVRGRLYKSLLR